MAHTPSSNHTVQMLSADMLEEVKGAHILIVEGRFYTDINDDLIKGATQAVKEAGATSVILTVAGALEIPPMIMIAINEAENAGTPFDGVVALGCVIRGETGHYDIVAGESSRALMDLSVALGLPLGNAILTVENTEQAKVRAFEKGRGAVIAALGVLAHKRILKVEHE